MNTRTKVKEGENAFQTTHTKHAQERPSQGRDWECTWNDKLMWTPGFRARMLQNREDKGESHLSFSIRALLWIGGSDLFRSFRKSCWWDFLEIVSSIHSYETISQQSPHPSISYTLSASSATMFPEPDVFYTVLYSFILRIAQQLHFAWFSVWSPSVAMRRFIREGWGLYLSACIRTNV